jgi:trigger factor
LYKNIGGRKVHFHITVKKVQVVTLPELNDEFAANVTKDDDEPSTLLQLRVKLREDLQTEANRLAESAYGNSVLDAMVEKATVHFPEAMLVDRIHELIANFDTQLQRQGINLETYQKVMGITHEQLHEQYHDEAVASLNRSLVLGELLVKENIILREEDIEAEIEKTLAQFGEQAEVFRKFLDTPQQRSSIANSLLYERIMSRLAKIGKGESLEAEDAEAATIRAETVAEEASAEAVVTEASVSDATEADNVEESE